MRIYVCIIGIALFFTSCKKEEQTATQFDKLSSEATNIDFVNTVTNSKELNIFNYRNFYNGGGVGMGDINNDNLPDIYFTSNQGSNKLYLNKGNWKFEDITDLAGVGEVDKWSTGLVMIDINADGLLDIYVCNAGYSKGEDQRNSLFINNGDLTFSEKAAAYGLDDNGYSTHAAFFDYDKDGDLDGYILNNSFIPVNTLNYSNKRDLKAEDWPVKDFLKGGGDKFLRNEGSIFTDVSEEVGIYQSLIGFGLGVTIGDVNEDGYEDIYVSNDFFERDYLYINDTKGAFNEELENYFGHVSHSSMGADMRDINNDGLPEIFVTDMLPREEYRLKTTSSFDDINLRRLKESSGFYHQYMHNTLQLNTGAGKFKDISFKANVAATDWSWGALIFDGDNDGLNDIFVCNGVYHDVIDLDFMDFFANEVLQEMALRGQKKEIQKIIDEMPSVPISNNVFRNLGDLEFEEVSQKWGLDDKTFSNGAAYGDLDGDGDLDLVVNNVNQPALIYKNNSKSRGMTIKLVGPDINPFGVGAKIFVFSDGKTQMHELNPSRGFQSSVDYSIVFGLIDETLPDSVRIIWPDGRSQLVSSIDSYNLLIKYDVTESKYRPRSTVGDNLFAEVKHKFLKHEEDDFVDYYNERGIHRMLSYEGPAAAGTDLNGDGRKDFFIGGGRGQEGALYISREDNSYNKEVPDVFREDKHQEDTYAVFVDIDNDGDKDLLVGSGGNHNRPNHPDFRDRLYVNDGNMKFSRSTAFNVQEGMNTSVIVPWDYDHDGDQDLFIGSRSVPQHYGYDALHFLLQNDGNGGFVDVTLQLGEAFKGLGMITDGVTADIDDDGYEDLILVGDWTSPMIVSFDETSNSCTRRNSNLDEYKGWYESVIVEDFDGDGDIDLMFGNLGLNNYLESRSKGKWNLWINDFDNNGHVDRIMTYEIGGKDIPVMLKKDIADQVVSIKKENLKHADFANKSIQDLFESESLKDSRVLTANVRESYLALNNGKGMFERIPLPYEAQLSSVKAMCALDVDSDGDKDVVFGGNDFHFIPQLSRLDANFGGVLINDGKGSFDMLSEREVGTMILGETKHILRAGEDELLFIRNNDSPVCIRLNNRSN